MKTYRILLLIIILGCFSSPVFPQWIVQHSGLPDSDNPTLIFSAVNPNVCWGIQLDFVNPKCVLTTDGGVNWKLIELQGIIGINELAGLNIFAMSADTAWITLDDISGGTNGGIFKTTNGGKEWNKQETAFVGSNTHPQMVYFFDAKNGLTIGRPRDGYWEIYTTADGGTNWIRVPKENIPAPVQGNQFFPNDFLVYYLPKGFGQNYWFSSLFRSVYKTNDMGHTWSVVRNVPTSNGIGMDIAFKDSMNGLAGSFFVEQRNQLSRTTDGGVTWQLLPHDISRPSNLYLSYVPETAGTYIMTSHKNIGANEPTVPGSAYTLDNGAHWIVIDSLEHGFVAFTTNNIGWSAGNGDTIYKWNGTPLDTVYTDIIPAGAVVTKLSSDQYIYSEGPVWYEDSLLLFVDDGVGSPNIFYYDPAAKQFGKWPSTSTHCVGLTLDREGNLIGTSSNIIMINNDGQVIKTLAQTYNDISFNNPNDLIADKKGGIYFSDPDFFLNIPPQGTTAVYYIDSTGMVKRVIDDLAKPNGLIISPEGTKLYVVDTEINNLYSWDIAPDGSVSGKSVFAELDTLEGVNNYADGMAVDSIGNIYVATNMGIQVFTPQGDTITTIKVPESPSNCDFGGKDFKTLYITTRKNLYSIDLNYPGYAISREKGMPSAVNPLADQSLVTVYPNPVNNVLHIDLAGKTGVLEVLDLTGKSVLNKEIKENNPSIDVSGLKHGIYLVKVLSDNQLLTGRFVKQ